MCAVLDVEKASPRPRVYVNLMVMDETVDNRKHGLTPPPNYTESVSPAPSPCPSVSPFLSFAVGRKPDPCRYMNVLRMLIYTKERV